VEKILKIFAEVVVLRPWLVCFNNITFNINVIEDELVYPLPVNSAKEWS